MGPFRILRPLFGASLLRHCRMGTSRWQVPKQPLLSPLGAVLWWGGEGDARMQGREGGVCKGAPGRSCRPHPAAAGPQHPTMALGTPVPVPRPAWWADAGSHRLSPLLDLFTAWANQLPGRKVPKSHHKTHLAAALALVGPWANLAHRQHEAGGDLLRGGGGSLLGEGQASMGASQGSWPCSAPPETPPDRPAPLHQPVFILILWTGEQLGTCQCWGWH